MPPRRGLLSNAPPSAQRPRNSSNRVGPSSARQPDPSIRSGQTQLPPYESPACPMDLTARRALAELSNNANETRKYTAELETGIKLLGESVAEINDRYAERKTRLRARLERQRAEGEEVDDDTRALQEAVRTLGQEIPGLTTQCDEGVREVIDWGVELGDSRKAMATTVAEVEMESRDAEYSEAATRARKQRRREIREERREHGEGDDEEEEDEEGEEDDEQPVQIVGPLKRLKDNKRQLRAEYEQTSLHQRYGLNNDYIAFKKSWHDAIHGRDHKPLPDASRWFNDNGGAEEEEDEDQDLIVAGEKKDPRCPLSMVVMTEPYTSAKCDHTFEKTAIVEFLSDKPERTALCPQTGCSQEVSIRDFSLNQYILRQIKRSERQVNEEDDDMEEEEEEEEEADESMRITSQRNIKRERRREVLIEDDEDQDMDEA